LSPLKEAIDIQSSVTDDKKSSELHDDQHAEDEWYVIYSESLQQPFYYNKVLKMGRFLPVPPNAKPISDIPIGSQLQPSDQLLPQSQLKEKKVPSISTPQTTVTVPDDDEIIVSEVKNADSSSKEGKWYCPLCTFGNSKEADKCEMCDNPKKQHRRSQRKLSQTESSFFTGHDENLSPFPLSNYAKHYNFSKPSWYKTHYGVK
jgi:hypothetical protein